MVTSLPVNLLCYYQSTRIVFVNIRSFSHYKIIRLCFYLKYRIMAGIKTRELSHRLNKQCNIEITVYYKVVKV